MHKVVKIENERVSIIVDESTGTIIDIHDKVTNAHHLSVRHPELTLGTMGMGILTTHPFIGRPMVEVADNRLIRISGSLGEVKLVKEIRLTDHGALVNININGLSMIKESMHVACGNGGFWSESPGALYNCKYFVRFLDDVGDWDEYSSFMIKPPTSGFRFNKHMYVDRYFPDLKWIAFINTDSKVGIIIKCLSSCLGITEDQLFNVDLELINKCSNGDCALSYELILVHGLSRVDHVSESFIVGIEVPDLIIPGSEVNGSIKIYALNDLKITNVDGRVKLIKAIAPMGRRGYVLDRTVKSEKHYEVNLLNNVINVSKGNIGEVNIMLNTLSWDPEYYSQSMPLLELNINGETIKRAFSVNEDFEEALELVKERKPQLINSVNLNWNDYVESFFDEKSSALPVYELAVERMDSARSLVDSNAICNAPLQLLDNYLNSPQRSLIMYGLYTSALSERLLKLAVNNACTGTGLNDALTLMDILVSEFEGGRLIHWFNGLHGGAGSAGLFSLVLAFDLLESKLPRDLDNRLRLMFRWAQDELIKITNAWTYPLGNWELTEALALLSISLKFNFRNSDIGIAKALSVFRHALKKGFLNDGAWSELSAGYHMSALNNLVWASELLKSLNIVNLYEYARDGTSTLLKAIRYIWDILDEKYNMPALEDSGSDKPNPDPFIILGVRYNDPTLVNIGLTLIKMGQYIRNPLTLMALSNVSKDLLSNASNVKPTHEMLTIFNDSGRFIYRFKDGYDYFILDYGPHGGWHGHPDKLSFELHVNGEPIIVDSGANNYYGVNHWSWHRRSIAHNTITIEDKDQLETKGELIEYRKLSNGVEALFKADIYPGVTQTRLIKAVENTLYFIKDIITGSGTFRFNLNTIGSIRSVTGDYPYMITLSTNNTTYSITLPSKPNLLKGMRGHDIETNYIYYEKNITNNGVLWALVAVGDFKPSVSGCSLMVNGVEFNIC